MERKDTIPVNKYISGLTILGGERHVELTGGEREAELLQLGLRALLAQVELRDVVSGRGDGDYKYPPGGGNYLEVRSLPLRNEVLRLIGEIETPEPIEIEVPAPEAAIST